MSAAVVVGGGFAGLLAAAALAPHTGHVTVLEADRYPSHPGPRRGLPQSYHNHVLVTGGAMALEALLPGTLATLSARGAHRRGLPRDALILTQQGWFPRYETGAYLISCSRGLLDAVVRERVLSGGAVTVREGARVVGLLGNARQVTGVAVRHGRGQVVNLPAQVVVDATGRRSKARRWLSELGLGAVAETTVSSGLAYATRVYRAPVGLAAEVPAVMLHPAAGTGRPAYGATLFPIERDRWVVTLTGSRGVAPPADEPGFVECARSLRSGVVAELMAAAVPVSGIRPYRDTSNRRRFYEREMLPDGFLVLGDAALAVNPVHSHGMSVAALTALRLRAELARRGCDPATISALQGTVAAVAGRSWEMAIAQDRPARARPAPGGAMPSRAFLSDPRLADQLFRAQTLAPPAVATAPMAAAGPRPGIAHQMSRSRTDDGREQ